MVEKPGRLQAQEWGLTENLSPDSSVFRVLTFILSDLNLIRR